LFLFRHLAQLLSTRPNLLYCSQLEGTIQPASLPALIDPVAQHGPLRYRPSQSGDHPQPPEG
jgi:hypothetical protein